MGSNAIGITNNFQRLLTLMLILCYVDDQYSSNEVRVINLT